MADADFRDARERGLGREFGAVGLGQYVEHKTVAT
jgi:hypothetical protein